MNTETAQNAVNSILAKFQDPSSLPKILSRAVLIRSADIPCSRWSFTNRFLTALSETSDARGIKQWGEAGRSIKKGSKAFFILAPSKVMKTVVVRDPKTGEETEQKTPVIVGFRAVPVFRYEDTHGPELEYRQRVEDRIKSLPLREVAESWGIKVEGDVFTGRGLGYYSQGSNKIGLITSENDVWYHELVHAADDRITGLTPGQQPDQEVVAELGSAVLQYLIEGANSVAYGTVHDYIASYSTAKEVQKACLGLIDRVCKAVAAVLDTAEQLAVAA